MTQNSILVVGSLNMDQVVRVARIPRLGETLLSAGSLRFVPGGKGANQAVAMARLGASVSMAGRIGTDPFGAQLITALRTDNIDTSLVIVDAAEVSGVAFIFLAPNGDNAIVVAPGANMQVGNDATQLSAIVEVMSHARAVVLQLEIPLDTVRTLIAVGHKAGIPVVLNLAPAQPLSKETLQQVSILIVNEIEASLLTGQRLDSLEDACCVGTTLYEYGILIVVVTLGARGAILVTADPSGNTRIIHQMAPKVQVVDTTAAGDCFVGALTVALTEGQQVEDALRFAVYASTLKVTKFGAQSGLPTRKEVDSLLHGEPL